MNSKEALNELFEVAGCERCGCAIECEEQMDKYHCVMCEQWHNIIKKDLDRLEQLEKELKQTKLNFRNSQIHSKNCYKKLKEKYTRLERAYKNNEVMTRDLNELINRNLELKDELKRSQETISAWMENHKKLIIDNGKMKKAIEILKERLELKLEVCHNGGCTLNHKVIRGCITPNERCLRHLEIKEYELLKEVFENE